jgi:hypothetical protein
MPQTELVIIFTMAWSDMNASGAGIKRDEICGQDFAVPIKEWVTVGGSLQFASEQLLDWTSIRYPSGSFGECSDPLLCQ